MLDKVIKFAPYAMALMIGLIANRFVVMLKILTNNELLSNIVGVAIGLLVFIIWKIMSNKFLTKK